LDDSPRLGETERGVRTSLPLTDVRLDQPRLDLDFEPGRGRDGGCRLHRTLQRTGVYCLEMRVHQRFGQGLGLRLSASVEMNARKVSGKFVRLGEIIFTVAYEEKYGHGCVIILGNLEGVT